MLTISITIEASYPDGKLDDSSMFLDDETEKKLDQIMSELEKECSNRGLKDAIVEYNFFDEDLDEGENILSEGITVTEIIKDTWSAEEDKTDVEEDGKKYRKT